MNSFEYVIPENFAVKEADELKRECSDDIKKGQKNFIFNFKNCEFIDSTGLGVLVSVYKKCKEINGTVELIHVNNKDVLKVFKLTRLDEIFNI